MYRTFQWSFKRETASWMAYNFLYNYDLIKNQHTVQQHCSMSSSSAGTRRSSLFRGLLQYSSLRAAPAALKWRAPPDDIVQVFDGFFVQIQNDALSAASCTDVSVLLNCGVDVDTDRKNENADLATKPRHPTSMAQRWQCQPRSSQISRSASYFSNFLSWAHSMLPSHGTVSSMTSTLRSLSDQITISGRKVVIAIWVGKVNDVPRSARTLHSPYGNYSLDTFPIGKSTCQITFIYSTYIKVCN